MKKTVKISAFLICIIMLLSACAGQGQSETSSEISSVEVTTEEPAAVLEDIRLTENGKCCVTVIRPDKASDDVVQQAINIRTKLESYLGGVTVNIGNDFVMPGKSHDSTTYEILVGQTNYEETAQVLGDMRYLDYGVCFVGHKVVVTTPNDSKLNYSSNKILTIFKNNIYKDDNGDYWLKAENDIYRGTYKVSKLTINGVPLEKYQAVYSKTAYTEPAAEAVVKLLATATGVSIPIVPDSSAKSEYEIIIGKTNRIQLSPEVEKYDVYMDGNNIVFNCLGEKSAEAGAKKLYSLFLSGGGDINLEPGLKITGAWDESESFALTEGADVRIISFNIQSEMSGYGGTDTYPRAELLANILAKYNPDAVGIQEVDTAWRKYIPVFCGKYKLAATTLADGSENISSLIYNSEKYDLVEQGAVAYSMTLNKRCRNMGWALLKNKTTGDQFVLISTHWDFDESGNPGSRDAYRQTQANELAAFVKELKDKYNCPVFATGDFNCKQDSTSMSYFRSINNMYSSYFDSAKYLSQNGTTGAMSAASGYSGNSIDFVFSTKENTSMLTVVKLVCYGADLSDHRPVLADIKITK